MRRRRRAYIQGLSRISRGFFRQSKRFSWKNLELSGFPSAWPDPPPVPSHIRIIRPAAAFGGGPVDVLLGVLDVAGFAMDAVLRVDDEARILARRFVAIDDFIDAGRQMEPRRLAKLGQVDADGNRRVLQAQMDRLILFVIGVGKESPGRVVESGPARGVGI